MKNRLVINPNYYVGYILHILTRNSLYGNFSFNEGRMNITDDQKSNISQMIRSLCDNNEDIPNMINRIGEVKTRELISQLFDYADGAGFLHELERTSKSYSLSNKKLRRNEETI